MRRIIFSVIGLLSALSLVAVGIGHFARANPAPNSDPDLIQQSDAQIAVYAIAWLHQGQHLVDDSTPQVLKVDRTTISELLSHGAPGGFGTPPGNPRYAVVMLKGRFAPILPGGWGDSSPTYHYTMIGFDAQGNPGPVIQSPDGSGFREYLDDPSLPGNHASPAG